MPFKKGEIPKGAKIFQKGQSGNPAAGLNKHLIRNSSNRVKNKFKNTITTVNNIRFDSKKEAKRYTELLTLERAGLIKDLRLQDKFQFTMNGEKLSSYYADFTYINTSTGEFIVEDVKSDVTRKLPVYRLKKKMMLLQFKIKIKEI